MSLRDIFQAEISNKIKVSNERRKFRAEDLYFDNTISLTPYEDIQNTIDYIFSKISTLDASSINYDNTTSQLSSNNVQDAIDEYISINDMPLISGIWYDSTFTFQCDTFTTFQVLLPSDDEIVAMPIFIPYNIEIDRMACEVTTLKVGGSGYLGIYSMGTNGLPDVLLHTAGSFNTDTTGAKEITTSYNISRGWYWLAIAYTQATDGAYFRAINNGEALSKLGYSSSTQTTKDIFVYSNALSITTGLPSTFPLSVNRFPYQCPRVSIRVV